MKKNVLILGCGYVGTALARLWQTHDDFCVTVTTTREERLPELRLLADQAIALHGDDPTGLRSQLESTQILVISVGAKRGIPYTDTYLKTAETLRAALVGNTCVEQIIYTSSYAVYGDRQGAWVTEDMPAHPTNDNGEVLYQTEQILLSLAQPQRPVCVLRLGGIYGPGRELNRIFQNAAGQTRPGDGSNPANWVHLDDIVGAIDFGVQHRLQGLYNLVDSQPMAIKDLLDWVCDRHQLSPIHWDPSLPSSKSYNAKVSNQKLRDAGYRFQHPAIFERP